MKDELLRAIAVKQLVATVLASVVAVGVAHSALNAPGAEKGPPVTADIRDFGAVGDGKTSCTAAIQKAIDECAASVLRLVQVDGVEIRRCKAPAAADPFLLLEGNRTRRIVLEQNDFGAAAKQVDFRDGASAQAVLRH